jgi:hypothetical protein
MGLGRGPGLLWLDCTSPRAVRAPSIRNLAPQFSHRRTIPAVQSPQPALILDYASPRKHLKLRMPARSHLDLCCEPGRVMVIEKLRGKGEVIGAIAFAVFMLIYMGVLMFVIHGALVWLGPFWLAEAIVLVLVIHQTWRQTVLTVTSETIDLAFASPFTHKSFQWPAVEVVNVLSVTDASLNPARKLAELRIRMISELEVHLFTDHSFSEIEAIVAAIRGVLEGAKGPSPG